MGRVRFETLNAEPLISTLVIVVESFAGLESVKGTVLLAPILTVPKSTVLGTAISVGSVWVGSVSLVVAPPRPQPESDSIINNTTAIRTTAGIAFVFRVPTSASWPG